MYKNDADKILHLWNTTTMSRSEIAKHMKYASLQHGRKAVSAVILAAGVPMRGYTSKSQKVFICDYE